MYMYVYIYIYIERERECRGNRRPAREQQQTDD